MFKPLKEVVPGDVIEDPSRDGELVTIIHVEHGTDSLGKLVVVRLQFMRANPFDVFTITSSSPNIKTKILCVC